MRTTTRTIHNQFGIDSHLSISGISPARRYPRSWPVQPRMRLCWRRPRALDRLLSSASEPRCELLFDGHGGGGGNVRPPASPVLPVWNIPGLEGPGHPFTGKRQTSEVHILDHDRLPA